MKFIKTIQNSAYQYDLWQKGQGILVGVSGGADSVCLLDVLAKLAKKYDFKLHIAHVNYGLRGKDSEEDCIFVQDLAKKYELEISILKVKKAALKGNLESNLRDMRYVYFEKLRLELGLDLIAVAHNSDDQAETVLMRIIRGSGLKGLIGMAAKSDKVIRPLLKVSRKEILAYNKENKLKFRVDKTNFEEKFVRNKIRHKLLPYLEKNFNPAIKKTLAEWSVSVADDYAFMAQSSERFVAKNSKNKCVHFNSKVFLAQHVAVQRQVLREVFAQLKSDTKNLESTHIEELLKIFKSDKSKPQNARVGGLKVSKKGDNIEIFR